ncbi:MAG: sigma factor-like helix-turn-helix DNA-binding protein, partial [Pseudomonadota bacterium]
MMDFQAAFELLSDEQREALTLVGAEGFSYEDAAETCGVAVGTIKSRVNRGRARLTELMGLKEGGSLEMTDAITSGIVSAQKHVA